LMHSIIRSILDLAHGANPLAVARVGYPGP
jgi:hypothetical protein